jgi:peptidoglycan hydrolase CwlO-like protein
MKKKKTFTVLLKHLYGVQQCPLALSKRFLLIVFLLPLVAHSQTSLEDFKASAGYTAGIELIPFKSLRTDATAIAAEVDRRKTETQSLGHENFEKQKANLYGDIKKENDEIEKTRKFIEELKKSLAEVSTDCLEKDIKKYEDKIARHNEKISELNGKIKNAADIFNRLYQARAGLREYFDKVLSQLAEAKSNPKSILGEPPTTGSDPTDEEKKRLEKYAEDTKALSGYIQTIETNIRSQAATHKQQEDGALGTQKKLEELAAKTAF